MLMMRLRVISSRNFLIAVMAVGFSLSNIAQAEAPVVELSSSTSKVNTSGMDTSQRLTRLENIVAAQNALGTANQITTLQQKVQDLQGRIDLLEHQVTQLQRQMKQQYSDVNNRLKALESGKKASTPSPTGDIVNEHNIYQKAYSYIKAQHYPQANKALTAYIKQYPQGTYVPNAYFWLGEVSLAQGNIKPALALFQTVATRYSSSTKAPDALLKLGSINAELGNKIKAKQQLNQVIKNYPSSSAATSAKAQLTKLN